MNHEQVILFWWLLRSFCNWYNLPNHLQIHTDTKPFFTLPHTKVSFVCFFFLQLIHLHTPHICITRDACYSWQWMGPTNAIAACNFPFSSSILYIAECLLCSFLLPSQSQMLQFTFQTMSIFEDLFPLYDINEHSFFSFVASTIGT